MFKKSAQAVLCVAVILLLPLAVAAEEMTFGDWLEYLQIPIEEEDRAERLEMLERAIENNRTMTEGQKGYLEKIKEYDEWLLKTEKDLKDMKAREDARNSRRVSDKCEAISYWLTLNDYHGTLGEDEELNLFEKSEGEEPKRTEDILNDTIRLYIRNHGLLNKAYAGFKNNRLSVTIDVERKAYLVHLNFKDAAPIIINAY